MEFKQGDIVVRKNIIEWMYEITNVGDDGLIWFRNMTSGHVFFKNKDVAARMYEKVPEGSIKTIKVLYGGG